ncbi:MAG TPA: cupin domain-containing protein [Azospirillaceae bacterium]|nr:cupin domain-containing protein [Azospirillaceae bacterium]
MTRLTVYADGDPAVALLDTDDPARIADALAPIGVAFERWQASAPLAADADAEAVLAAYAPEVARLKQAGGYTTVDVARVTPATPNLEAVRTKFLDEHTHGEDEVRFFVEGSGAFYLHRDGKVFQVVCHAGDLLSVPAGIPHWFDMGPQPRFTAIRFFRTPEGWVASFTGDGIAKRFPLYEAA